MCVIIDNSVSHHVFSDKPSEAAQRLLDRINSGRIRFVTGGHNLSELRRNLEFKSWVQEALRRGTAAKANLGRVNELTSALEQTAQLRSNDAHVIALAQLTGARLLFSDDRKLNRDFENPNHIDNPSGSVYTTLSNKAKSFTCEHAEILARHNLCGSANLSPTV